MGDVRTPAEALALLEHLQAPSRLIRHGELVLEAARELVSMYRSVGVGLNDTVILLGAVLHDAGKTRFPSELEQAGKQHEAAGERLLLEAGVAPQVAKCCVTHANWSGDGISLEERTVALADKLWKGKREERLELLVIDEIAATLGRERWDLFVELDGSFEQIAADGPERLRRAIEP